MEFDNGMVYMDDDLETTECSLQIIHLMKHIMIFVFKQCNIKTDLDNAAIAINIRYIGWLLDLQRKAVKMPADKKVTILSRLKRFSMGHSHVITGTPKKSKFLFSGQEIAAIAGSLLHFADIHHNLKPYLTPFYRLLDGYDLSEKKH